MDVLRVVGNGFKDAFLMGWEVWWALVLGFAISAVVQAWVPRERIQAALGGRGFRPVALASGLGAASSSCSYAAVAIAKSLFQKGASAAAALAFQFSLDEPSDRAGDRDVGLDRLAVHARGVRRWARANRDHDPAAAPVRLQATGRAGSRARPSGRQRPSTPQRRRASSRSANVCAARAPGRMSRTTSATTPRWCGKRS